MAEAAFVDPPFLDDLISAINDRSLVVLVGTGCGKRTAGSVAMRRGGHTPIIELPGSFSLDTLIDGIERVCSEHPEAGILVADVDSEALEAIAGFRLQRLRKVLSVGHAIVLTSRDRDRINGHRFGISTVVGEPPDPHEVVLSASKGLPDAVRDCALQAVEALVPPVSPRTAVALLKAARAEGATPSRLVATFGHRSTDESLDTWLRADPTPQHLAWLAAAAVLENATCAEIDEQAGRLARVLCEAGTDPTDAIEGRVFNSAHRGWPKDVVHLVRRPRNTHFGRHEAEVVEICSPHRASQIVLWLWEELGADFRGPFIKWLRMLGESTRPSVAEGAAWTAGVLFAHEPGVTEEQVLRPWAVNSAGLSHAAAGLALGVPVAIGEDPRAARGLVKYWGSVDNLELRRIAVLAYGGPLGLLDPSCAAPAQLWRLGEDPALQIDADIALALLVVGGRHAAAPRATVFGLLLAQADRRSPPVRVWRVAAMSIAFLGARDEGARESLKALLVGDEGAAFEALAELLVLAFNAPSGYSSACAAIVSLLEAVAGNRLEERQLVRFIREMKSAARTHGCLARVGGQLKRAMKTHGRTNKDKPSADIAESMLRQFYSTT